MTFYVASKDDSALLSCATTLALGLIQPHTRLDYVPPRASLVTSSVDHPKKTKCQLTVHVSERNALCPINQEQYPSSSQARNRSCKVILKCLMELDVFLDHHNTYRLMQTSPQANSTQAGSCPSERTIQARIDKMLQASIQKPIHQATPWMNSFVFVEGKDKLGKLKLRIYLDPTI